jgi:hypothetical protein
MPGFLPLLGPPLSALEPGLSEARETIAAPFASMDPAHAAALLREQLRDLMVQDLGYTPDQVGFLSNLPEDPALARDLLVGLAAFLSVADAYGRPGILAPAEA